ncbi:BrnT family toxin [Parasphingorhabdus sp.]|uniref:BrnT family toxin n=1 Tax=Parasphingorhabdus sp. TaxID=2709688 RepID=UPI003001B3DE
MKWRWDQRKAAANKSKHGVSFELAALVFDDPLHLSQLDSHPDENRWKTIGRVSTATLLVVHTYFDDESGGRIISARKATAFERKAYEEET